MMNAGEKETADSWRLSHLPIDHPDLDLFGFKPYLKRFVADLACRPDHRLVGLFAPWGCGKTSALNLCARIIQTVDQPGSLPGQTAAQELLWVPPFESWRYERAVDLEVALLWHIRKHLPKNARRRNGKVWNSVTRLAKAIVIASGNVLGQATTGVPWGDVAKDALLSGEDGGGSPEVSALDQALGKCQIVDTIRDEFERLGKLLCEVTRCDRVIIPIDDMDRCSPESATKLLFSLKHLLVSDRISFVVAVDRSALARFMTLHYGMTLTEEDSQWFLEKVFDDWVELPEPEVGQMFLRLCAVERVKTFCGEQFQFGVLGSPLKRVMRNPRKLVRAAERFLRLVQVDNCLARFDGSWPLKFALCLLHVESPLIFEALRKGTEANSTKPDRLTPLSACLELWRWTSVQVPGAVTPNTQPRIENAEREITKIRSVHRAVLASAAQDRAGPLWPILEWIESKEVKERKIKQSQFENCIVDVMACL